MLGRGCNPRTIPTHFLNAVQDVVRRHTSCRCRASARPLRKRDTRRWSRDALRCWDALLLAPAMHRRRVDGDRVLVAESECDLRVGEAFGAPVGDGLFERSAESAVMEGECGLAG